MVLKNKLVVGNWKMYINRTEEARTIVQALKRKEKKWNGVEVWVAPSAPIVPILSGVLKQSVIRIGAQTVSAFDGGAHTGDVSAAVYKDAGATFAIVGHSERRNSSVGGGESDAAVTAELSQVLNAGLYAVLCIGEPTRDEHGGYFGFLSSQLRSALQDVAPALLAKLIIAYEPVWAIGEHATGAARPEVVRETTIFIRKTLSDLIDRTTALKIPILYGGSVDATNVPELLDGGEVAGFLVGRASTQAESFLAIVEACSDRVTVNAPIGQSDKKKVAKVLTRTVVEKNVKFKNKRVKSPLKMNKFHSRRTK